jgi:quercetin dioxygenase-like cupin family protein
METFGNSDSFLMTKDISWETVGEGLKRKIMGYDDNIMLVHVAFENGAIGSVHKHHNSQVTYVVSGVFDITIDSKTKRLKTGDSFFVPTNVLHGAVCIEKGELIDVFSPIREDFME